MKKKLNLFACFFILVLLKMPVYADRVLAEIEYFYSDDGTLIGKAFNGKRVNFEYDLRGQLLAVKEASGKDLERYTYDPAGNRLSKRINGVTTTYTYDKANQLVTSTVNGITTHYKYDAAGRMIQAGDKKYIYNGQNKVSEVRQNGKTIAKFEYNIDGQIAKAIYGDKVEEFMWDGLALIWRSGVTYINEPYVTGGNPVMAGDDVLFNDMLGNTLAVNGNPVEMTSFGETTDKNAFFTGKPMIDELGYSFLFRDYSPNQGKWTTTDPLGYPDGWNNLAYCGNHSNMAIDTDVALWSWATGVVGAGLSVAGYVVSSLLTESDITTAGIASAAAGGFVTGALAGGMIGDPSAATMSALMLAGATSNVAGQLVNNAVSTTLDPNKQYNYATLTNGVLRNGVVGALTGILPLKDILAGIVALETGVLDNLYAYSKKIILNALEQLNQNAKNRLMEQEKLME